MGIGHLPDRLDLPGAWSFVAGHFAAQVGEDPAGGVGVAARAQQGRRVADRGTVSGRDRQRHRRAVPADRSRLNVHREQAAARYLGQDEALELSAGILTTVHGPQYRLLIIGAGDMSSFLAQIASKLDYDVTICDPRTEYTQDLDVPGVTIVDTMPDDTVIAMKPDSHTAIVTLTHDPKLDDLALMEALKSDAFYIGAIGSRRNSESRRDRLLLFDVSREQLKRLRGPVGLHIGSKTPFEIAVSIAAELTAVKNGVQVPHVLSKSSGRSISSTQP